MSDSNFQPIFDYIDKATGQLDAGLRADMATKADIRKVLDTVFDHIDETKQDIIETITKDMATKGEIKHLQESVDAFGLESKNRKQEDTIHKAQTHRIEKWVMEAAEKVEIPYNP